MARLQWTVLWSLWAARLVHQPTETVRLRSGTLRGFVAPEGTHKSYLAIPYASYLGRFKPPGPEPTWEGLFEAVNEHVRCPQRVGQNILIGQEVCMTLNVYTPLDAKPGSDLAVMVYIHGGGFYDGSGSGALYGPDYLVEKGVVLVTVNYRLNMQGFGCLGIKELPGNAGLKDQVAALKWVQRNIKEFGGDPENVTIFGESAGAASVSYHVLSQMSKGLFHKAIMQSGSPLAPWALQFRPAYIASLLTKVMLHKTEDPYELYDILMNKTDYELIITRVPRKPHNIIISECLYVPCVEKRFEGIEPFITDIPLNILSKGEYNKVPMILGVNSEEGYLFAAMENDTTIPKIDISKSLPKDMVVPEEQRLKIADNWKRLYLGNEEISKNNLLNLSRFHGEVYFSYPVLQATEMFLNTNDKPVYSYMFKYDGWRNFVKIGIGDPYRSAPGATHADDIFYLFRQFLLPKMFENKMIDRMTTMWTNFAKYGDPTPVLTELLPIKWHPADKSSPQTFVIDTEFSYAPLWASESARYLRELYSKYRRKE
ncbi:esterase FE4-like [Epargyreus clarus]|uniref:esterase FE4-like n=1 Tax=Epargyreus clarus TaxID=520877 RepID=UPI003C2AF80B